MSWRLKTLMWSLMSDEALVCCLSGQYSAALTLAICLSVNVIMSVMIFVECLVLGPSAVFSLVRSVMMVSFLGFR